MSIYPYHSFTLDNCTLDIFLDIEEQIVKEYNQTIQTIIDNSHQELETKIRNIYFLYKTEVKIEKIHRDIQNYIWIHYKKESQFVLKELQQGMNETSMAVKQNLLDYIKEDLEKTVYTYAKKKLEEAKKEKDKIRKGTDESSEIFNTIETHKGIIKMLLNKNPTLGLLDKKLGISTIHEEKVNPSNPPQPKKNIVVVTKASRSFWDWFK